MSQQDTSLTSHIQTARRLHHSGAGTVLDVLLRSIPSNDIESLANQLMQESGITVICDSTDLTPDWSRIDHEIANQFQAVLVSNSKGEPILVMADPWNGAAVRTLSRRLSRQPHLAAATHTVLHTWIGLSENDSRRKVATNTTQLDTQDPQPVSGPVVAFVDSAIQAAYKSGASDVHFECSRVGIAIKFRQDGVMSSFAKMDDPLKSQEVISRIKVLAQLDITERRTPQDGRFRFSIGSTSIDLRVSIMPSVFGEDAVLRLLDKAQLRSSTSNVSLDLLGFAPQSIEKIRDLAELPHGMLLVTGPTGSGKTTTVYAMLSEINNGLEKIITIEDPVEYELPGVLQIPVNERKGLTFAKGLRSILRHDPDRILVGEIRDAETAEIAVQSALTGHQVLTTVHANSVFDVTGRFKHFGLDVFGFMSSLNGVIVQRLVRKLCSACAQQRPTSDKESRWLARFEQAPDKVWQAFGCETCHGSGYHNRIVLAEVHSIDDHFRDLVLSNAPVSELREYISRSGTASLGEQASQMIINGITTPEEIRRVVGWQ